MKQIPIHEISLKEADGYSCTEQGILERELTRLDLYGTEFAYTAFNPKLKETVLKNGTHRINLAHPNYINCCIVNPSIASGERGIRDNDEYDLVFYMEDYDEDINSRGNQGMFAVYDKSRLVERSLGHPFYKFREPENKLEALLAVIEVNW